MMLIELAKKRVKDFEENHGEVALQLAFHAALPVAFNADLLHLLRINFFLDPPKVLSYTAEFELLLSPLCEEIGEGLYEIKPEIRKILLKKLYLLDQGIRLKEVASLLWQYLDRYSPWNDRVELERAQQLTALNFLDPIKAQSWLTMVEAKIGDGQAVERDWYIAMREEIDRQAQSIESPEIVSIVNDSQTFWFDVAEFVETPEPLQRIPYKFEVATIELQESRSLFGRKSNPKVVINRRTKEDWQYVETLEPKLNLELVKIPAGIFMMGAGQNALEAQESERPQHFVKVPELYMGKYPITQAQWRFGANLTKIDRDLDLDPSNFKGQNLPVERVSWLEAIEFCARLSLHTGREYGLPTEAEREYACRADTVTPFYFGETIDPKAANYNGGYVYGPGKKGIDRNKTIPVGSLNAANEYGLHDMHGNVWEWCQDYWHNNYQGAPDNGSAWINTNAEENKTRVLRGGSWLDGPSHCRSAARDYNLPDNRFNDIGFRVVSRARTS
jgi:formylglycine-generating enzyme required for sulfatase activity